jgi:adenine-specific DNA methylase
VDALLAEHAPPAYDPFCGGGSIPLEAQRLGLRAYASDLNPVAVLITEALIEIPPKFAGRPLEKLGEDGAAAFLRRMGEQCEISRDLAYRLYSTCERKKWAQDALA